jgi:polyisoprenyl-teichoic acid--peptidoglycan teichoic acid transferase
MKPLSPRAFLHRFITAFVIAAVVMTLAIAGAYAQAARKVSKVSKVSIDTSVLQSGGNFLLIGSDTRAFVQTPQDGQSFGTAQQETGQRSDTIMVVHVDGDGTALVVSFPRDLWVDIPGMGHAKINAAFNAGPQRLIETIEKDFDVPISHYLEVDFSGFRDMVNKLGTIPIYFPAPARDAKTGLDIRTAGCVQLNGSQALAFVRSRYYESFVNGEWRSDPSSDLGRIQRQQYFLRTLAQQILHAATKSPWKASGLADMVLNDLQRDPKLGLGPLRALAYAFHKAGGVQAQTLPVNRYISSDGQDALALDSAKAAPLLARLRGIGNSSDSSAKVSVDPGSVHVVVENGSGKTGAGARAADALGGFGFSVVGPATNADKSNYSVTEVRYASGASDKAKLVQSYLGGAGTITALNGSAPGGADIVLVLGTDYKGLSRPSSTTAPKSTAGNGSGSTGSVGASGSGAASGTVRPAAGC